MTTIRFFQLSLTASLLGAALLVASTQIASAAEFAPATVAAPVSQTDGNGSETAPAPTPAQLTLPLTGETGFGWG